MRKITSTEFKLEYYEKNNRLDANNYEDPPWKNKIKEIENRFSELIDLLEQIIPEFASSPPNDDWTPFWIAVYEIQCEFNLPGEDWDTEYEIDTETLTITRVE